MSWAIEHEPDRGEVKTRLQALEVLVEDVTLHGEYSNAVICRQADVPGALCGTRSEDGYGCVFCFRCRVEPGDTAEEIEARVRRTE
mgnify:FL=1